MITLPTISITGGTPEQQVAQMRTYLIKLVDSLQFSLNNIGLDSLDKKTQEKINTLAKGE